MNLPVILLKGLFLFPSNDIRLEFDNDLSNSIIDIVKVLHNNKVLVVSQINPLEENPTVEDLPQVGVIGKITHHISLPNGKTRVTIDGLKRVKVKKYYNVDEDIMEAQIEELELNKISEDIEKGNITKLCREIENYIKTVPTMSNSLIALINNEKSLDKITDIIIPRLAIDIKRKNEYIETFDSLKRVEMILEDIYHDEKLYEIEKSLDTKVKKEIDNNQREFLLREKIKMIKEELGDLSLKDTEILSLKEKLNNLDCSEEVKKRIKFEIKRYENIPLLSPEIGVIRTYIDWLLELPWNKYTVDQLDLNNVKKELDKTHYGIKKVKMRIIEYLAVQKQTNGLNSPIICLVGPPGVGKTSFAYSVAKSMNRNFVKISLGGVSDEAEIIGHRKTYLGSSPGRIIDGIKRAGSCNPVFLIDEVDKMGKDHKGDPASSLLEILDNIQNKHFKDNYIEEEFDLSHVMFILTANTTDTIPKALKDRLEIIKIPGYTEYEKLDMAQKHLIPKICNSHGLSILDFKKDAILEVIRHYTKEAGVRELERSLSSIIRKIVTLLVTKKMSFNELVLNMNNPEKYLGKPKYNVSNILEGDQVGVVNGLSCTSYGGEVLPIEVNYYKGRGHLILTGSLGDVIKESAKIALSYIKANHTKFNIKYDDLIKNDIHIHIPSGSILKEGPSAGVALTTSLISAFSNLNISSDIAMTGEITLRGKILPIGGLKEKSIGAKYNHIKKMFIPKDNMKDLDEIPDEIKESIEYIPVTSYEEIYERIV